MDDAGLAGVAAVTLLVIRFYLAIVFIRAGLTKLADLAEFRLAVTNYKILPASLANMAAVAVPVAEVTAGLLLLLGVLPGIVAAILALLLVCFSAAIGVNLARGRVFDCGCGGSSAPQLISWRHVVVNLMLAALAVLISIAPPAGFDLLHGPHGVFSIGIPAGSRIPIVLAAVLGFMTVRMLGAAVAVRRALRATRG
jgi:uncharacterized membrane protein YphA (DoxX/SURF4 family)